MNNLLRAGVRDQIERKTLEDMRTNGLSPLNAARMIVGPYFNKQGTESGDMYVDVKNRDGKLIASFNYPMAMLFGQGTQLELPLYLS